MQGYKYEDFIKDVVAGEDGDMTALARAACALYTGNGISKDVKRSKEYFEKAVAVDKSILGYKAASILIAIYFDESLKEADIVKRDELKNKGKELVRFITAECKDVNVVNSVKKMEETYDSGFKVMRFIGKLSIVVALLFIVGIMCGTYFYFTR